MGINTNDKRLPSEVHDVDWLYCKREKGEEYPKREKGEKYVPAFDSDSGKWLVFARKGKELDDTWTKIRDLVIEGKLGGSAKCSTMMPRANATSDDEGVICVYTYSLSDLEDVRRIREVLREQAGITRKIPYKTDVATTSHLYKNKGDKRISSLYE